MSKSSPLHKIASQALRAFVRHAKPLATANRAKKVSERVYQIEFTEPNNAEYVGRMLAEKVNLFRPSWCLELPPPLFNDSACVSDPILGWYLRLASRYDLGQDRTIYVLDILVHKQPMRKGKLA